MLPGVRIVVLRFQYFSITSKKKGVFIYEVI
jgi:hypothetical protein